jgi:simple sugar transport system substrate-binding protein
LTDRPDLPDAIDVFATMPPTGRLSAPLIIKGRKTNMYRKVKWIAVMLMALAVLPAVFAANLPAAEKPFVFGMLLVGPYNDHGWSQAHYEAGRYVEKHVSGSRMIYIDKVNPADRPGVTVPQLADDLVEKGARLIIANSDDMKDGTREAAAMHPDIKFIHISGDDVLTKKAGPNLTNLMGRMEYGKMMAGFTAAMTTRSGKIGYLGPLINEETRRLAAACYLGAKYAWETVLKKNPADLTFQVTWIGFWFNIPGVTADPTQVANNFYNSGFDVVVSGIDTTEALVVAGQKRSQGRTAWAIPYDYVNACSAHPPACLGVPYFNWGPGFKQLIEAAKQGAWKSQWLWYGPDWKNINNPHSSTVGFVAGPALSAEAKTALTQFIADLGSGTVNLFKGPLNYQDGSVFLKAGETAGDRQIWYMKQLLQGMKGQSSAKK